MGAGGGETPDEAERLCLAGVAGRDEDEVLFADFAAIREEFHLANDAIGVDAFGDDFDARVRRKLCAAGRTHNGNARGLIQCRPDRDVHRGRFQCRAVIS